ncbi:MAG: FGGY family carbohydrate kinase [Hyphomicrobium sp.]|nr:FGGY family carbohydrate kinase [Hyphomicrobium sp.]
MATLAIDQGTTSTRAILVDEDGNTCTLAAFEHRQSYPAADHVEHDAEELLRNVSACLSAGAGVARIHAVGIDNQGESCLAWDAATGTPVTPVIVWQDARTSAITEAMRAEGVEPFVLERAGLPLDPYFSATKLAWIVRNSAEAQRLLHKGQLRLGTTDAFFLDRLTGRFVSDITTASRSSLMNLAIGDWDPELCRLFGVPIEALPKIVPTTGSFGDLKVGETRVPLTASVVDQQASLYGHGCRKPGDAKITFGTGAFALKITGRYEQPRDGETLPTVAWQKSGEAPVYALDGGVYCASAALNWARSLGLFRDFAEIERFERPAAIARGLAFVPALAGLACPHWDRGVRGTWLGLAMDTGPLDMVQAVLEGVALRTAEVVRAMERSGPLHDPVSIDGGMAANRYFCQFLASVLGRPVLVSSEPELTAVGTAALAAEAAGQAFTCHRRGRIVTPEAMDFDAARAFEKAIAAARQYGR